MEATLRTRRKRSMGRCRSGTTGMENIAADYREKGKTATSETAQHSVKAFIGNAEDAQERTERFFVGNSTRFK